MPVAMEELHSLDPRRQGLLEARFTGAVTGNTAGSTGSTSGGAKVTVTVFFFPSCCLSAGLKIRMKNIKHGPDYH